jgi:hypothetical protein
MADGFLARRTLRGSPNNVWSTCFALLCNDVLPWETIIAQQVETCVPHITLRRFNKLRFGVDMPLKSGGSFYWEFVDPNKLLASIIEHSPGLSELYTQALGGAPGINICAVHDTICLFRPPCGQLYSLTLAVPLKFVSGTPLDIISLATQRAELPAYHCNVCCMVAAGDDG